jgi:outer membrane protein TolC
MTWKTKRIGNLVASTSAPGSRQFRRPRSKGDATAGTADLPWSAAAWPAHDESTAPDPGSSVRRSRARRALALVAVLGVIGSGCLAAARGPSRRLDAVPTDAPPVAAAPTAPEPAPDDGWAEASETDVDTLVTQVLARNPTLAAMRAAWRAAAERYPQVTALDDPQLTYGLAPETIGNSQFVLGQRFDLSQRLPWPGKLATRGKTALHEAGAAAADVDATRLRLIEAAREAFFDWWYVHRALAVTEADRVLLAELRDIAETRYAAGLGSKQDALQAEVAHQHVIHRDVVLDRMRDVALARLNTLLNRPPQTPVPPPPATVPSPVEVPSRPTLEAEALARRPILRGQRRRIDARKTDVRLAELEYFPNLVVMGTYDSVWQEEELRSMVSVGVNVPLQLARRRAAVSEARARVQEAESMLEQMRADVLFDVSRAADEVHESAHVVHLYATSIVPAAEESLAAARSGYEAATNDFLTLIQAEKSLLTAQLGQEEGLAAYHKARARLERAVGAPLDDVEEIR